ncbi:MAG: hypothetical protein FWD40_03815 [Treponema sp.]|nr:hypothetical protein [Treponema sp.]
MKLFKFFLLSLVVLSLVSISCSTTSMPRSGPYDIPQDFFGLVHAGQNIEHYELLNELGAVWCLHTFYWEFMETKKGEFDFLWSDLFVDLAKSQGKKVIAVVGYETPWIFPEGKRKRYIPKENVPDFLNFLEITVNRYKGKVDAWQIWNEPNWIYWKGPNKEFYELIRLSNQRIRETDPDAYIVGGGFWRNPKNFIREMHRAGAFENIDAVSFHPYATTPRGSTNIYDDFVKLMAELNFTGDIWITEVGYPTAGWYPTTVSLANYPSFIIKTIAGSAARGARALLWYEFFDSYNMGEAPNNTDSEMFFGLVYPDLTRKDGAWSYELCARYLPGTRYNPDLPVRENVNANIVSFCFTAGTSANNVLLLWNDRKSTQKIRVTLGSSFTLHDIATGESVVMQDNSILDISNQPSFITWQGSVNPAITRIP